MHPRLAHYCDYIAIGKVTWKLEMAAAASSFVTSSQWRHGRQYE
jgi:hypothetical protein